MKQFLAIVHKDPDSAFGVTFPDIPGCFSAADTMEDVLPHAIQALELWFEDQPEVEPQPLEAIRIAARDDLAEGAFLIAVPLIRPAGRSAKITLSMDRGIVEAIDAAAMARGLTRSGFLAEAARNEISGLH